MKRLDFVIDQLLGERKKEEPEQQDLETMTKRKLNKLVREWVSTKREITDLQKELSLLEGKSRELSEKLLPVVKSLSDQKLRVDDLVVSLRTRITKQYKQAYERAVELLEEVNTELAKQAKDFLEEVKTISEYLKLERTLADIVSGFIRKFVNSLRVTEEKIATIESMVNW